MNNIVASLALSVAALSATSFAPQTAEAQTAPSCVRAQIPNLGTQCFVNVHLTTLSRQGGWTAYTEGTLRGVGTAPKVTGSFVQFFSDKKTGTQLFSDQANLTQGLNITLDLTTGVLTLLNTTYNSTRTLQTSCDQNMIVASNPGNPGEVYLMTVAPYSCI